MGLNFTIYLPLLDMAQNLYYIFQPMKSQKNTGNPKNNFNIGIWAKVHACQVITEMDIVRYSLTLFKKENVFSITSGKCAQAHSENTSSDLGTNKISFNWLKDFKHK